MRRNALALLFVLSVGLVACGNGSDPSTKPTTPRPVTTTATADPVIGVWTGTWRSDGSVGDAILTITDDDPLTGKIQIVDTCDADWDETGRAEDVISVAATVTSGDCIDNEWEVKIRGMHLTTIDPQNSTNSLDLERQSD